ncbi:MAG: hypothetical protein AB7G06_05005 [Bdellovibrionales bacterium]
MTEPFHAIATAIRLEARTQQLAVAYIDRVVAENTGPVAVDHRTGRLVGGMGMDDPLAQEIAGYMREGMNTIEGFCNLMGSPPAQFQELVANDESFADAFLVAAWLLGWRNAMGDLTANGEVRQGGGWIELDPDIAIRVAVQSGKNILGTPLPDGDRIAGAMEFIDKLVPRS